jgi:hypothetical protein
MAAAFLDEPAALGLVGGVSLTHRARFGAFLLHELGIFIALADFGPVRAVGVVVSSGARREDEQDERWRH